MRNVTLLEKTINSTVNVIVVLLFFLIIQLFIHITLFQQKMLIILLFLSYKLIFLFFNKNRTLGMMITQTYWKKEYPLRKQLLHAFLYTLSFSTLLFWIVFPFDLFLLNILFLQLPTLYLAGMTFHEFIVGGMEAVKR